MTENQKNLKVDQEDAEEDAVLAFAMNAAKELLVHNPVSDIDVEATRVLGDLSGDPNSYEVDNLLGYPWFRYKIVDTYFSSMKAAKEEGKRQPYREQAWLSKLITYYGYSSDQADEMVRDTLANYITDPEDGRTPCAVQELQFVNKLHVLNGLAELDPAAARSLTETWGITAFERYHTGQLYAQYMDVGETDSLCITPRTDHNGAFLSLEYKLNMYAMRPLYIEGGSATELARIAVRLRARKKRFKKVIVAAHSDGFTLDLSNDEIWTGNALGTKQLAQDRVREWISDLGILEDDTEMAFLACSVGKEGGIQDEVQKIPEVRKTHAATEASSGMYMSGGFRYKTKDGRLVGRVLDKSLDHS